MNLGLDAHHLQPYGQTSRSGADRPRHQNRVEHRDRLARHPTATTDMKLAAAPESAAAGKQAGISVAGRLDTHWSRILYRDALTPDTGSNRERSPLVAGAILLGIYVALFFAVAGIARVLTLPNAAAAVTGSVPIAPASAATAAAPTVGAGDSRQRGTHDRATNRSAAFGECGPRAAIDSECMFD